MVLHGSSAVSILLLSVLGAQQQQKLNENFSSQVGRHLLDRWGMSRSRHEDCRHATLLGYLLTNTQGAVH